MRNSPKISVTEPVSMPPARRVSSCLEPVVMEMSSERRRCISVAVVKPMGTSLEAVYGEGSQLGVHLRREGRRWCTFSENFCGFLF